MTLRLLACALLATGCATSYRVRHLTPAVSEPGTTGYAVSEFTREKGLVTTKRWHASAAAASPPAATGAARDVVWRVSTNGKLLELCRPLTTGGHQCQLVPRVEGSHGGPVVLVERHNLGQLSWQVTAGDTTHADGTAQVVGASDLKATPHYGVWLLAGVLLQHCRVVDNQPECQRADLPGARAAHPSPFAGYRPVSVHVLRDGDRLADTVWLAGAMGARGLVRCQAGASGAPTCTRARMIEQENKQ